MGNRFGPENRTDQYNNRYTDVCRTNVEYNNIQNKMDGNILIHEILGWVRISSLI